MDNLHDMVWPAQVYKLSGAGSIYSGKSYVNEFGIGAVEMTVQPDAVLSPWYSSDDKCTGARHPSMHE